MQAKRAPTGKIVCFSANYRALNGLAGDNQTYGGELGVMTLEAFGDVVRRLRKDKGWTLDQLRDASGVNKTTLSQMESGKIDPRLSTLVKVAGALGFSGKSGDTLRLVERCLNYYYGSLLTGPVTPPSTNRESDLPKGDADDDPATARARELEARLDAQDRKIQALQNVLDTRVRTAGEQRKPRKAASDTPRRGRRDR